MARVEYKRVRLKVDDALIGGDDPMSVIDPVWWAADIYSGYEAYEESLRSFSVGQRLVLAVLWYDAEVNNGGHDQFYCNSTGVVWRDAMKGFEAAGLSEAAAIVLESSQRLGGAPSFDRAERNDQLEQLAPDFGDLDDRYYDLKDVYPKLMQFIRGRAAEFYFDGVVEKTVVR
jgi:hypothetical protein